MREVDDANEIEWCTTPGCVRPVTFHPGGMHLTEGGLEFGDQEPLARRLSRLGSSGHLKVIRR